MTEQFWSWSLVDVVFDNNRTRWCLQRTTRETATSYGDIFRYQSKMSTRKNYITLSPWHLSLHSCAVWLSECACYIPTRNRYYYIKSSIENIYLQYRWRCPHLLECSPARQGHQWCFDTAPSGCSDSETSQAPFLSKKNWICLPYLYVWSTGLYF